MLERLLDLLTGSRWTYLLLFGLCAGDAVLPILPSETALVAAGLLAALGRLELFPAVGAGAAGAVVGDNASYWLGRRAGRPAAERLFRSAKAKRRFAAAEDLLARRGAARSS